MIQIPEITTDRLLMRAPRISDHAREVEFYASDHADFVGGKKSPYDTWTTIVSRIGHWAVRGYGAWHLDELETGRYVGRVGRGSRTKSRVRKRRPNPGVTQRNRGS